MKKIILIMFGVILGVYLFNQILGDDPNTLQSASKSVMENQIELTKSVP